MLEYLELLQDKDDIALPQGVSGDFMNVKTVWKGILSWFIIVMVIFALAKEWSVVAFGMTYGLGFGGIAYSLRGKVGRFFAKRGLRTYYGFLLLAVSITVSEEVYCYALGNQVAHPVLWIDLIMVTVMWSVWFSTWYFFLSRRYFFEENEALLVGGFTGVFYEFVGTGALLENPFGIVLAVPLAVVVYAAIFVWPLQLLTFTGKQTGRMKYIVGSVFPFLLTIPVAVALYFVFAICGIQ